MSSGPFGPKGLHVDVQAMAQAAQNEKRFQEIEQALVLLLDAAENLPLDDNRKRNIRTAREHLQKRRQRPRP
jgi:hypothetical protein